MKKREFIFKHNDQVLERITWDIEIADIEIIKSYLAASKGIDYDDIDMETVEVYKPELSEKMFVRHDGSLMFSISPTYNPHYVKGFQPKYDINHEELMDEFLSLISKGDVDNAITFC